MNNVTSRLSSMSSLLSFCRVRLSASSIQKSFHHHTCQLKTQNRLLYSPNKAYQQIIRCKNHQVKDQEKSSLLKNFLFTSSICGCSFVGAIIWQHENNKKRLMQWNKPLPKRHETREQMNMWWNSLTKSEKLVLSIISANAAVFLMWRIPVAGRLMTRFFVNSPTKEHSILSNLFSAFSHHGAFHLFINMSVLWSFSSAALSIMGPEEFMAVYLSGAVISSFTSNLIKLIRGSVIPSVGASGAILALLGVVCVAFPNSRLSVMFVDQIYPHSFTAESGLKALIIFDSVGILLGWGLLDHAAHLGGVLFGIWYVKYGRKLIMDNKHRVIRVWENDFK